MKRIIIIATSDLATDQRVLKVAGFFQQNNFEVLLVGRQLAGSLALNLPYKTQRLRLLFNRSFLFYTEFNLRVFLLLIFKSGSYVLANDTDTLPAAYFASKLKGSELIFDAHELFPEVPELIHRPFVKNFWIKLEDFFFPRLKNAYTVCDSIAAYYNEKYSISMDVIRNIPSYRNYNEKLLSYENKKIILYQGALNKGRGLEWVINAMPLIPNAVLVIIGSGDIEAELKEQVNALNIAEKVIFMGRIPANELYKYTPSANIGLCLLEDTGLSYYYSLPNRIFDYLHAGVPVLSSRFPEIEKIVDTYRTGILIDKYDPEYLSTVINQLLEKPFDTSSFDTVSKELCWENESEKLLKIVRKTEINI